MHMKLLYLSCALALASAVTISNVAPRRDSTGEILDMHDGNVHVGVDGTYYWYAAGYGGCPERLGPDGQTGPTGCAGGFKGCGFYNNHTVNLFTSKDLVNWTPHGNVLPEACVLPLAARCRPVAHPPHPPTPTPTSLPSHATATQQPR